MAPANISEALALPSFINTTIGISIMPLSLFKYSLSPFLVSVYTISPLPKNSSAISAQMFSNPPGLFLKSKISPFIFDFFNESNSFMKSSYVISSKEVILKYPISFSSSSDFTVTSLIISLVIPISTV